MGTLGFEPALVLELLLVDGEERSRLIRKSQILSDKGLFQLPRHPLAVHLLSLLKGLLPGKPPIHKPLLHFHKLVNIRERGLPNFTPTPTRNGLRLVFQLGIAGQQFRDELAILEGAGCPLLGVGGVWGQQLLFVVVHRGEHSVFREQLEPRLEVHPRPAPVVDPALHIKLSL
jgi:hypothetical protein